MKKKRMSILALTCLLVSLLAAVPVAAKPEGAEVQPKAMCQVTLHWSSVDGEDLMEPITATIPDDTEIALALAAEGISYDEPFTKEGYVDWGYRTTRPITAYVGSENPYEDMWYEGIEEDAVITEDQDIYVILFKQIDHAEASIAPPVCGTQTDTPEKPAPEEDEDPWVWEEQTNPPKFTVPDGANYRLQMDGGRPWAYWNEDETVETPYIGTFEGGETYLADFWLEADFGYYFAGDVVVTGGEVVRPMYDEENYIGAVVRVTAAHDWGEWIVDREATTDKEGERHRVCKANAAHVEKESIPKKETTPATPETDKKISPKTGDGASALPWFTLLCAALCVLFGASAARRKR